jgi:rfaE bifunctional protein nucleotidyltransferase chain/domain
MGEGKIKNFKEVCKICHKIQDQGKKVVFCHGFFDILHRGHVTLLIEAKKLGDVLVVGVDHDDNAKILKVPGRPINDHDSRMFVLANLEPVDFVFLIEAYKKVKKDDTSVFYSKEIYERLNPNIVGNSLKAGRYGKLKKTQAESLGIRFVDLDYIHKVNTSKIIKLLGM